MFVTLQTQRVRTLEQVRHGAEGNEPVDFALQCSRRSFMQISDREPEFEGTKPPGRTRPEISAAPLVS